MPSFGSSPLARGTGYRDDKRIFRVRFIPAGAGNRPRFPRSGAGFAVHPRWRGEQHWMTFAAIFTGGSSPLARGTVIWRSGRPIAIRFIPAGAGNRTLSFKTASTMSVHPRWRGEQHKRRFCSALRRGSSPLARGTAFWRSFPCKWWRFIPAGAGNRVSTKSRIRTRPVHPRWRGEQGWR